MVTLPDALCTSAGWPGVQCAVTGLDGKFDPQLIRKRLTKNGEPQSYSWATQKKKKTKKKKKEKKKKICNFFLDVTAHKLTIM